MPPPRSHPQPDVASFQDPSADAAIRIIKNHRRNFATGLSQSEVLPPHTPAPATAQFDIARYAPDVEVRAQSTVGRAVLQRIGDIEWIGWSFVALLEGRIAVLKEQRLNSDEATKDIEDLEDLKRRVEEFLAAASQFARNKAPEQPVEKTHVSLADGLKNVWDQRHLAIGDWGLLALGAWLLHMTDPLSVLAAGTVVGGPKFSDAIKAWKGTK
jgi:hypothetical protein